MVIALALLSLAMILGGLYAVLEGWSIVLLERGWALMISGSVAAASGALLLGITAVMLRLGSIRTEMADMRERMAAASHPVPPPPASDPVEAVSAGPLGRAGQGSDAVRPHETEPRPDLPLFMRPADERMAGPVAERDGPQFPIRNEELEESETPTTESGPRIRLPDFLFPRRSAEKPASPGPESELPGRETEDERHREPAIRPLEIAGAPETSEPEPRYEPEPQPEPEPAVVPEAAEPEAEEPSVVGSYSSGDNRYVMFSDGSIEAHTPRGVYRFDSLDELKEFIASGGEERSTAP